MCSGLAQQYEGTNVSLSLPSTRVDAFNVTLAQELSRNGRRTGLTFAPEGGSERIRKVINKMVTEEDLIRTVVTAYTNGWRQVKLYFMCGLPTETDEDVLQIARLAHEVIKAGRAATGSRDIRCTVSIGGFVPKPHTPFQWASMATPETIDRRLRSLKAAIMADKSLGKAIGYRYHDGQPSLIEGLLARGDRRVGAVIRRAWEQGQRFDGWSEHFSYQRWVDAAARRCRPSGSTSTGSPSGSGTSTRCCRGTTSTPAWTRQWLWQDWQDSHAASTSRTTAAGRRASTAGSARPWTPRSRSVRPAASCSRSPSSSVALRSSRVSIASEAAARAEPGARGAAHPDPLRQAGPVALHLAPGLRPRLRARRTAGRRPDRVLAGLHPAPQDLLRQRRADRGGE